MKHIIILLIASLTSSLVVAQDTFVGCLTQNMKKDMTTINSHIKSKSAPAILAKDFENLLFHMTPQKGLTSEEILQIGYKLQRFPDYYDLEAACRLSLAYMYLKSNNEKKGNGLLSGMEFHVQSNLNKHPTAFQDFICAWAKYENMIPKDADGISVLGINSPTVASKSSNVRDIVFIRSELRRLERTGIKPSKFTMANELLLMVIKGYYQKQIKDLATSSKLDENVLAKMNTFLSGRLDSYIHQWVELKYPAEYLINPFTFASNGSNIINSKERDEKKIYASIRELSKQGYGPATYKVGVDYETERLKKELPKEAARCYELAYRQGSAAGAIRYAHCLTTGYGCDVNRQQAYEILRSFTQDVEFAKNGAYAYAVLLEDGYGGEADILDIMQYYTMAAEQGLRYTEKEAAQKRVNQLYEKYYK